ncbi:MAG: hypothetical protein ACFFCE_13945 [Promethearchaeota archaeon]
MNESNNEEELNETSVSSADKEQTSESSFKSKLKDKIGGGKERLDKFTSKIKKEAREVEEKLAKFKAEKEVEITVKKSKKIIFQMCGAVNDSTRKYCSTCHLILN